MAISDRITSIEEHIKESYQELEGIGIDTTGVNKNLENIPKLIDGYWETLPKVTGEGTSITLDNTKEGKMKIVLKGNTSQATTTQSKNLMPNEAESQTLNGLTITKGTDGSLLINGTSTATTKIVLGITNLASGTYTLSTHKEGTVDNSCYLRTVDTTTESEISGTSFNIYSSNSKTYTLSENKRVQFDFYTGGNRTFTNFKIYPMAESGSTATDYVEFVPNSPSPDYPQDIHVVSGNNTIKVEGKNLFDKNNINGLNVYLDTTNNKLVSNNNNKSIYISCKPNTTYTISKTPSKRFGTAYTYTTPANNTAIYGTITNYEGASITITTDTNAQYLVVWLINSNISGEISYQTAIDTLQIEYGNQATTYVPYQSASYPITLPEGMFLGWIPNTDYRDIIFQAKTGDTYYDSLDSTTKESLTYGKWYLNKQIGKVVLNGSESWNFSIQGNVSRFDVVKTNAMKGSATSNPILSTHFKSEFALTNGSIFLSGSSNLISIMDNDFSSANDFKVWLSSNNVIVYYAFTTPTYTEITDSTLISQLNDLWENAISYKAQTNITQTNNDLPFIISATALREMS